MHLRRGEGGGIASDRPRHRGCVFLRGFFFPSFPPRLLAIVVPPDPSSAPFEFMRIFISSLTLDRCLSPSLPIRIFAPCANVTHNRRSRRTEDSSFGGGSRTRVQGRVHPRCERFRVCSQGRFVSGIMTGRVCARIRNHAVGRYEENSLGGCSRTRIWKVVNASWIRSRERFS